MKIPIIATESSGDYLGFHLIRSLKKFNPSIKISGVGGELMESTEFKSWVKLKNFDAIGIFEVLIRLFKFIRLFSYIKKKIIDFNPDILITIDSPSFNYRLTKSLKYLKKTRNIKFIHYVAPTVWAWKAYRAKIFASLYDKMFTVFGFEPKYFNKFGLKTKFIGHQTFFNIKKSYKKKKIICFLPGSRTAEIKNNIKMLKRIMIDSSKKYKDFRFFLLTFENQKRFIKKFLGNSSIKILTKFKDKQRIMSESFLAIAASGSVTLELTKYKTPLIVVYKTHFITEFILKLFVKVKFATILNIHYDKEIIPEFIFEKFTENNVKSMISDMLTDNKIRNKQIRFMEDFCKKMIVNNESPSELFVKNIF